MHSNLRGAISILKLFFTLYMQDVILPVTSSLNASMKKICYAEALTLSAPGYVNQNMTFSCINKMFSSFRDDQCSS